MYTFIKEPRLFVTPSNDDYNTIEHFKIPLQRYASPPNYQAGCVTEKKVNQLHSI